MSKIKDMTDDAMVMTIIGFLEKYEDEIDSLLVEAVNLADNIITFIEKVEKEQN